MNTKIEPVLTEKSLESAEKGEYTFLVDKSLNKYKIKKMISEMFEVEVSDVRTMNNKSHIKTDFRGRQREIKGNKKAIVKLKGKDEIDLFETS